MNLWEVLGVSREVGLVFALLGLGLALVLGVQWAARRSGSERRVRINLSGRE